MRVEKDKDLYDLIFRMIDEGKTDLEISQEVGLSMNTINRIRLDLMYYREIWQWKNPREEERTK